MMQTIFNRFVLKGSSKKHSYYIYYTLLFCVVAFASFSWFVFSDRSLIWHNDGWTQHFKALVYYAQYLRRIIRHLVYDHKLIIPDWDFFIGEGSDILNAFHYYVIGDPIALFSVFIPTRYMHYFYSASCIVRLYLAGIAFSFLCFETGQKNHYGILAGSIAYSFCSWALVNAARHPYFLNPMIYFPLMIVGIERILKKEKPYMFILSVAISAASNFYFFYMIVILAVLYTVLRLGFMYPKQLQKIIRTLLQLGLFAIIGVCIAGIILLPVLMMFLQDSRLSVSQPFHWLYPMTYYSELPSIFISDRYDYWLCMGYVAPVVLAVFLLFLKKENTFLKVLFGIMTAIMLFPIGGRFLNGMSYATNRWSWALAILCMYIFVKKWEDLISISYKEWVSLIMMSLAYLMICLLFEKSRSAATFSAISLLFIVLIIVRYDNIKKFNKQLFVIGMVVFGIIITAFWRFSPSAGNYISEFKENRKIWDEWSNNESTVVKKLTESSYTRLTGRSLTTNANILNGISSTQYYWTISNPYVNNFRSSLYMREPKYFSFQGYDDRTTPIVLSAVQYYSTKDDDSKGIPYGFTFIDKVNADSTRKKRIDELKKELAVDQISDEQRETINKATSNYYSVFKNNNALPITYCYDTYISKEVWDSYNPVQKQEIQLDAAYTEEEIKEINTSEFAIADYRVEYDIECQGKDITQGRNCFITTADNTKVFLNLHNDVINSETYVGFSGLGFTPTAEYELYFGSESVDPANLYNKTNWDVLSRNKQISLRKERFFWNSIKDADITIESSAGTKKTINYLQPESTFSSGRHDFIANLGYLEEPVSRIIITFPTKGIYSFTGLDVYSVPMKGFEKKIAELRKDSLQNITFETDTMTGTISLNKKKLLCFATPFSTGWEATIDGTETEVYCLNERYPGIVIPKGDHIIQFHYHMPYKKEGFILSLLGIGWFVIIVVNYQRKIRKKVNV